MPSKKPLHAKKFILWKTGLILSCKPLSYNHQVQQKNKKKEKKFKILHENLKSFTRVCRVYKINAVLPKINFVLFTIPHWCVHLKTTESPESPEKSSSKWKETSLETKFILIKMHFELCLHLVSGYVVTTSTPSCRLTLAIYDICKF